MAKPQGPLQSVLDRFPDWKELVSSEVLLFQKTLDDRSMELGLLKNQLRSYLYHNQKYPEFNDWWTSHKSERELLRSQRCHQTRFGSTREEKAHIQSQKTGIPVDLLLDWRRLLGEEVLLTRLSIYKRSLQLGYSESAIYNALEVIYPSDSEYKQWLYSVTRQSLSQKLTFQSNAQNCAQLNLIRRQKAEDKFYSILNWDGKDWKSLLGPDFCSGSMSLGQVIKMNGWQIDRSSLQSFLSLRHPDFDTFIQSDIYQGKNWSSNSSELEAELEKHYQNLGIRVQKLRIGKFECDLYFPDFHKGFELNGYYHHCTRTSQDKYGKSKFYHRDKTTLFLAEGYRIYHYWYRSGKIANQDEDPVSFINSKLGIFERRLFARKLRCTPVDYSVARDFLNLYHRNGAGVSGSINSWGLFSGSELVGVLSARVVLDSVEIYRLAYKSGVSVIGGSQRLLSRAVDYAKSFGVSQVFAYCDRDLTPDFQDSVYYRAGFNPLLTDAFSLPLQLSYYVSQNIEGFSRDCYPRQKFQKYKLSTMFPEHYSNDSTADEILAKVGIFPVWNSGCWKFVRNL